jgi:hypothetical protein
METVNTALVHFRLGPWEKIPFANTWKEHYEGYFSLWLELDEHVSAWVWEKAMAQMEGTKRIAVLVEDVHPEGTGALSAQMMGNLRSWLQQERLQWLMLPARYANLPWLRLFPTSILRLYQNPEEVHEHFAAEI